jgi:hypothetical protein
LIRLERHAAARATRAWDTHDAACNKTVFEREAHAAKELKPGKIECPMTKSFASILALAAINVALPLTVASAQTPEQIAAPGETVVARLHAEGAQVYECKANPSGQLAWQFREPVATLLDGGKTVGRHYAGPSWELADGSAIEGRVSGRAAGATPQDIPLLKLEVTSRRGSGLLADVTTVQRINTKGGVAEGACPTAGAFLSAPYAADYVFLKKAP